MMKIIDRERSNIIAENKKDLDAFNKDDQALYDRLVVNEAKVDGMIQAIKEVKEQEQKKKRILLNFKKLQQFRKKN